MQIDISDYHDEIEKRFTTYARIDTESDPLSTTQPSTEKQKDLGRVLVSELLTLGLSDAHLDDAGYVYATLKSNSTKNDIPTVCYCAHMDTSPDCSGKDVKPIVHRNYQGQQIVLPDDHTQILTVDSIPNLAQQIGHDIVTASGTTLLGADDKAGVTAIMCAAHYLIDHQDIIHGDIKILFTPDEEIGRGVEAVDMTKLNADFGYTVDGGMIGTYEDETFSADALKVTIYGVLAHPGFAKGIMENSIKIAADIIGLLPKDGLSPETTDGVQGFVHPVHLEAKGGSGTIDFILRDFDTKKLDEKAQLIRDIVAQVQDSYPNSRIEVGVTEQYRNMKEILKDHPRVSAYVEEAIQEAELKPISVPIRGGTDGSKLSFMGLPCANVFAGEHAIHSQLEYVSIQDMAKSTEVLVRLAAIWEKNS